MISLSFSIRQPHKMNIFGLLSISFNFYVTNHHHAIISMSNHSHTINVAISLPLVCLHFTHIYTKKVDHCPLLRFLTENSFVNVSVGYRRKPVHIFSYIFIKYYDTKYLYCLCVRPLCSK